MKWLLLVVLLVALMFFLSVYDRKNKPTNLPRKDLLPGFDFSKGSLWKSSSMTRGTGKHPSKVGGEPHDQDTLDDIFRPRTDEGGEKKGVATIVVEDENPAKEGGGKKDVATILVEDDSPTDEGVGKKDVATILVEDENHEG